MNKIAIVIGMVGLAYLGFEHDSGWCFAGSAWLFLSACD